MDKKTKQTTIIFGVLSAIFLAAFLLILFLVVKDKTTTFDLKVIDKVLPNRSKGLTNFIKIFTHIGSVYFLIALTVVLVAVLKGIALKLSALLAMGSSAVVAIVFKYLVKRDRPLFIALIEEDGYSFPSAHALICTAVLVFLAGAIFVSIKNKPIKIILITLCLVLPVLVGLTRVYLGVHYMTDVLAGYSLGLCCASMSFVFYNVANLIFNKQKRKKK